MDEAAWGALALTLTLLGGIYTWVAYQRRGLAAGLRGGAITLLPLAAWLTGILELITEIGGAVGDWAIDLALDPRLWIGSPRARLTRSSAFASKASRSTTISGVRRGPSWAATACWSRDQRRLRSSELT